MDKPERSFESMNRLLNLLKVTVLLNWALSCSVTVFGMSGSVAAKTSLMVGVALTVAAYFLAVRMKNRKIRYYKTALERVNKFAYKDPLTGLLNRRGTIESLSRMLARAQRHDECVIVMMTDLNKFKLINDNLGHDVGDDLLRQIAGRLMKAFRKQDTIGRLGGDEFMLVFGGKNCCEKAKLISEKVMGLFSKPFDGIGDYEVSISIGISIYPEDGIDQVVLMKKADIAMYIAKETGTGYQIYCTPDRGIAKR